MALRRGYLPPDADIGPPWALQILSHRLWNDVGEREDALGAQRGRCQPIVATNRWHVSACVRSSAVSGPLGQADSGKHPARDCCCRGAQMLAGDHLFRDCARHDPSQRGRCWATNAIPATQPCADDLASCCLDYGLLEPCDGFLSVSAACRPACSVAGGLCLRRGDARRSPARCQNIASEGARTPAVRFGWRVVRARGRVGQSTWRRRASRSARRFRRVSGRRSAVARAV